MPISHIAAMMLTVLVWALNHLAVKIGVGNCPPLLFAAVRLLIVALVLLPFSSLPRGAWTAICWISFWFGAVSLGLSSISLVGIDAATSAIIVNLGTPFSILAGRIAFGEKFGAWRWAGVATSFIGVALLAGEPTNVSPWYFVAAVVSIGCWAIANAKIKSLTLLSAVTVNGWVSALAAVQLAAASWALEDRQVAALANADTRLVGALLFAALASSVVGHTLWNWLLQRHPIATIAPFNLLVPVVGFVAALIVLDEPLTCQKAAGGLLAVAGVSVIQLRLFIQSRGRPAAP